MKRVRLITIVAAVLLVGWLAIHAARNKEPSYQGRTLTEWLQTGEKGELLKPTTAHDYPFVAKSVVPIQAIGTNGIPTLLRLIKAHDSKPKRFFLSLHDRQSLVRLRFLPDWFKQNMGVRGFAILGGDGISAVPELLKLTHDGNGDDGDNSVSFTAGYVLFSILGCFQHDKDVCLPILLKLLNDSDPDIQLNAANSMRVWFPEEAQKAGVYKKFPKLSPSSTNNVQTNP